MKDRTPSRTKTKEEYLSPEIDVLTFQTERGFAVSGEEIPINPPLPDDNW